MRQVWKTELHPGGWQEIESRPIFFDWQSDMDGDKLLVWFEHSDVPPVPHARLPVTGPVLVRVYGTGHEIQEGAKHLMSCSMPPYIWHLYTIERGLL